MIVTLIRGNNLTSISLPEKVNGRFWLKCNNENNHETKLISVEESSGQWILKCRSGVKIIGTDGVAEKVAVLNAHQHYKVMIKDSKEEGLLWAEPALREQQRFRKYIVNPSYNMNITIGRNKENTICFNNKFMSGNHAVITFANNTIRVIDESSTNGTFVNNYRVHDRILFPGDVIFIMGMKIVIGNHILAINNPNHDVTVDNKVLFNFRPQKLDLKEPEEEEEEEVQDRAEYFYRSPRFRRDVKKAEIKIDAPPTAPNPDETPIALLLGPSMTMGIVSMATAGITINGIVSRGESISSSMTTLLMSFSMMLSCVLWPVLTKKHEKKVKKKKEKKRQKRYMEYLQEVRDRITKESIVQTEILHENNVPLLNCKERIRERRRNLWERSIGQKDFLDLRLGLGDLPLNADLKYSEKRFTIEDDNLQNALYGLVEEPKLLHQVPITLSLTEEYITGIIGKRAETLEFIQGLLIQLVALHSYDEVKAVFIVDSEESREWEFAKWLPHTWTDDQAVRFFATNSNETKELSAYFEPIISEREQSDDDYTEMSPYYVVIAASRELAERTEMVRLLLDQKKNIGFTLITLFDELQNLPKETSMVVEINGEHSALYDKDDISAEKLIFKADIPEQNESLQLAIQLANIKLDLSSQRYSMPNMLTFLEMYGVGKIEHLNPLTRWEENNPTKTLQAPVGVDGAGQLFYLDLHEKYHGPHGLVAGMTGSGKSEFIITYILSMAVNYHPDEVAFILIDYKGGGLTGAFEDEEKGIKLPHLAGTITNLDGSAIKRSLISIQSELRRRQAVFNEARKISNEGTMDIYKYQQLHREGVVQEAIPHLFIISDEFAELKQQQPDFMQQLISAARIGRSLGVHLILATQKPNGVVDDQIWSNSRFRVCLKVQEKADSMDMIKRPDAASLSNTGRFYLQVGFNEFFDMGQSAWCGAQYHPSDTVEKKKDNSIRVVDDIGRSVREIKPAERESRSSSKVKQIVSIVKYLSDLAEKEHIGVRPLWLDAIPAVIFVDDLVKKYEVISEKNQLNPVVGEYDDPFNQSQSVLTVPLSEEGNVIVYGSTGSGKEGFISSMVYSLISTHTPEEVNLYLLDFGAETLRAFTKAPHVGEVLYSSDIEKINNLFSMLRDEVTARKKLFADYGGDYQSYCKAGKKPVPNIVVVINNFAAFSEMFEALEDSVATLTREGVRMGILFVLTASAANAVRYRLQQNFKQLIVLQLNDPTDYSGLIGNTDGVYPSKMKGRGLIKYDKVYEFQSAYVSRPGSESDFIKEFSTSLAQKYGHGAKKIPILPDVVDYDFISSEITDLTRVPIGVAKQSLEIKYFDYQSQFISLISAQDTGQFKEFLKGLILVLSKLDAVSTTVVDPVGLLAEAEMDGITYETDDMSSLVVSMFNDLLERNNTYKDANLDASVLEPFERKVILITGLTQIREMLSEDEKDKLKVLLEKGEAIYKMHIILCESVSALSMVSYEVWYKNQVNGGDGIWIGDGITEQYYLKVNKMPNSMYEEIGEEFGYLLKKGKPVLIKSLRTKGMEADR